MYKLLIVEDDLTNLTLLDALFSGQGYTVFHAQDGRIVLDIIHDQQPDLILLDMRLPGMSGWEIAAEIRAAPDLRHIPIIAVSVEVQQTDRQRALEAGCNEYIEKPYDIHFLRELVHNYLSR